jgi:hypothetical protein
MDVAFEFGVLKYYSATIFLLKTECLLLLRRSLFMPDSAGYCLIQPGTRMILWL